MGRETLGIYYFDYVEEGILAEVLLFLWSVAQCRLDCCEKVRAIEWLVQKIDCAFVEGRLSSFSAIVGRYKDDRQLWTHESDATLQLDPIHSWHANVGYHTSRSS
ncbi:MAG TPA: hypothetical protein VN833_09530 [Candidatus Acidoferrales bacterium]|nr:hypothetical protein [Candidatus Acidoferrales bacterium]